MRLSNHTVVVVGLLGIGCSGRSACDGRSTESTTTTATESTGLETTGAAPDSDGATGTLEPCPPQSFENPEELTRCGAECVALAMDARNCGECGHVCPLAAHWLIGTCQDHECVPAYGPCVQPGDAIPNCEALCNTIGQHCGGNGHSMWFSHEEGADCSNKTEAHTTYDASCDAPFDWDRISSGGPAVGARCICTNEE